MRYDVIIIGAGSAGSHAAAVLARCGYKVVVLEKDRFPGESVCCTGIIGSECADAFSIDPGLIIRRLNGARIYSPDGNSVHLWRDEPPACIIDHAAFSQSLYDKASRNGAEYLFSTVGRDIAVLGDGVNVIACHQGADTVITARSVVIAAGFSPNLTEKLGLGRIGDFVAGAQVEVSTTLEEVEVYLGRDIAPGFFGWLAPTSPGKALAGLLCRSHTGHYLRKLISSLIEQKKIANSVLSDIRYDVIPLRPLPRTYTDRLLVIGDAAGQVKPTTGGGIYYGLIGADLAATVLDEALKENNLSPSRLGSYQRSWRRKLGKELQTGYWARKLFERLSDNRIDRLIGILGQDPVRQSLLETSDLSFDWQGRALVKAVGHTALSRLFGAVKFPFHLTRELMNG